MNKIYLIKAAVVLTSLLLLTSCDPETCGTAYITNKSSDTVELIRPGSEPKSLAPDQVDETGPVCGIGRGQTAYSIISGLEKVQRDTVPCKRDIRIDTNWTTTKSSKYKYEHRFVITDQDF